MGQMFIFYTRLSALEISLKIPAITASNDTKREAGWFNERIDGYSIHTYSTVWFEIAWGMPSLNECLDSAVWMIGMGQKDDSRWCHRVTHGSFCTETSFYTEDIYIYLYIFIYLYAFTHIHTHTQPTHSHIHTHKRSLIGFLCSSKNSWQPASLAEKGLYAADSCPLWIVFQRQTLVFIWQVEPVPAWDRNNLPLAQTQSSKTFCLVPVGV